MNYRHCSDFELLEILIGRKAALKTYQGQLRLLFGSEGKGIKPHPKIAASRELLLRALREDLRNGPVLSSPQSVRDYLRLKLVNKEHEVFVVLFLNTRHAVIEVEELFRGTLAGAAVHPREVVKRALRHNASAVILAHNHPSGVAEPSRADEAITHTLKHALGTIDVSILDHFLLAGKDVVSFAERGLL